MAKKIQMTIRGREANFSPEKRLTDGSLRGRIRTSNGNSIRGRVVTNSLGVKRFVPSNPTSMVNW